MLGITDGRHGKRYRIGLTMKCYGDLETGSEAWLFPAYMDRAPAAAIDFIKGWGLNGISSCCLLTRQHRQSS
jgi:hypothetical protein